MKLKDRIALLQTHKEEMGDVEVTVVLGEWLHVLETTDVDFGYNIDTDAPAGTTEATLPICQIMVADSHLPFIQEGNEKQFSDYWASQGTTFEEFLKNGLPKIL